MHKMRSRNKFHVARTKFMSRIWLHSFDAMPPKLRRRSKSDLILPGVESLKEDSRSVLTSDPRDPGVLRLMSWRTGVRPGVRLPGVRRPGV